MKREILTWTDSNKEVICKKEEPENGIYIRDSGIR